MTAKRTVLPLLVALAFVASCDKKKAADNYNKFQKQINKLEMRLQSAQIKVAFGLVSTYNQKNKDAHLKKMGTYLKAMQSILADLKKVEVANDEIKKFKTLKVKEYEAVLNLLTLHNDYMKDPKKTPPKDLKTKSESLLKLVQKTTKEYMALRQAYIKKHKLKEK